MLFRFRVCNMDTLSVTLLSVSAKVNGTKTDIAGLLPNTTLNALQCKDGSVNVSIANVCNVGGMYWASLWVSGSMSNRMSSVTCTAFDRLNVTIGQTQVAFPSRKPTSISAISLPSYSPSIAPFVSKRPTAKPSKQPLSTTVRPTVTIVSSTSPPISICHISVRASMMIHDGMIPIKYCSVCTHRYEVNKMMPMILSHSAAFSYSYCVLSIVCC